MKEELQEAEKLLADLHRIHLEHARKYSHDAICIHRYRGQEEYSQTARENALSHNGIASGLQTGLTQIKNLLQTI